MFLQIRTACRPAGFSRAMAGVCVVFWLAGSISTLYGSPAPQWTTPHCPQSHSNPAHQTHGACAWHCDNIDNPSSSGRSWRPSLTQTEFLSGPLSATSDCTVIHGGITSRGPPRSNLFGHVSTI